MEVCNVAWGPLSLEIMHWPCQKHRSFRAALGLRSQVWSFCTVGYRDDVLFNELCEAWSSSSAQIGRLGAAVAGQAGPREPCGLQCPGHGREAATFTGAVHTGVPEALGAWALGGPDQHSVGLRQGSGLATQRCTKHTSKNLQTLQGSHRRPSYVGMVGYLSYLTSISGHHPCTKYAYH